jgi:hypothetical protein
MQKATEKVAMGTEISAVDAGDGWLAVRVPQEEPTLTLCASGVAIADTVRTNVWMMLLTTGTFFIIQIPATLAENSKEDAASQVSYEARYALVGLFVSVSLFLYYLRFCWLDANEDKVLARVIDGIKSRDISLSAALTFIRASDSSRKLSSSSSLLDVDKPEQLRIKKVLRPFFARYDEDASGELEKNEFSLLIKELGLQLSPAEADRMFKEADVNDSGDISFDEFADCLFSFIKDDTYLKRIPVAKRKEILPAYEIEGEEDEEIPEDLAGLDPDEQFRRILFRSFCLMGSGTFLVLLFSDPFVEVLAEWSKRYGVSPFYVAFVFAPFASNASELLAAYNYAVKKTAKSMTTSLSTLVGAACMNNTLCLAIFFALIYAKGLAWTFTAETISIITVQWLIAALTLTKSVHTFRTALLILMCYPGCLMLVWTLENVFNFD